MRESIASALSERCLRCWKPSVPRIPTVSPSISPVMSFRISLCQPNTQISGEALSLEPASSAASVCSPACSSWLAPGARPWPAVFFAFGRVDPRSRIIAVKSDSNNAVGRLRSTDSNGKRNPKLGRRRCCRALRRLYRDAHRFPGRRLAGAKQPGATPNEPGLSCRDGQDGVSRVGGGKIDPVFRCARRHANRPR